MTRRSALLSGVSAAVFAADAAKGATFPLEPGKDEASRKLLVRMLKVMFPHRKFADGPYERTADAIFAAAGKTAAGKMNLALGLDGLRASGFAELDGTTALDRLKGIEGSEFFQLVRSTAITTLYDQPEVWDALGYEGPSFDKGGYINRGFNNLDWLPDPRIEEADEAQLQQAGGNQ